MLSKFFNAPSEGSARFQNCHRKHQPSYTSVYQKTLPRVHREPCSWPCAIPCLLFHHNEQVRTEWRWNSAWNWEDLPQWCLHDSASLGWCCNESCKMFYGAHSWTWQEVGLRTWMHDKPDAPRQLCTLSLSYPLYRKFTAQNNIISVLHPPYSPDWVPANSPLFTKMKVWLKSCGLDITREIQCKLRKGFDALEKDNFENTLQQWQECWESCIPVQVDFFVGDNAEA